MGAPMLRKDMLWCCGHDGRVKQDWEGYYELCLAQSKPRFFIRRNGASGRSVNVDVQTDGLLYGVSKEKRDRIVLRLQGLLGELTQQGVVVTRKPHRPYVGNMGLTVDVDNLKHARHCMETAFDILKDEGLCTEEDYR